MASFPIAPDDLTLIQVTIPHETRREELGILLESGTASCLTNHPCTRRVEMTKLLQVSTSLSMTIRRLKPRCPRLNGLSSALITLHGECVSGFGWRIAY